MKKVSPVQRTLRVLREQGLVAAVVEKWNPFARQRQDLFGIIDILVLDPNRGVVGIQVAGNTFARHLKRLTQSCATECRQWLSVPGTSLELWAWRKLKRKRGGKAMTWEPVIRSLKREDFDGC